ncbi:hypothetical protein [Prevotella koreensis]
MKRNFLLLVVLVSVATFAIGDDDDVIVTRKVMNGMEKHVPYIHVATSIKADRQRMARFKRAAANGLTANFGVKGGGEQETIWAENFDNGSEGWTLQNGQEGNVKWKTAAMAKPSVEGDV